MTRVLRPDVELIRGNVPLLFDRQVDAYFKVDRETLEIISYLSEPMRQDLFLKRLNENGVKVTQEELCEILTFLQQNNLLLPLPGEVSLKKAAQNDFRSKNWLFRISSAYLFFRLPPWRPERFLKRIEPFAVWITSVPLLYLYGITALIGYVLLVRDFGNALTEFRNSLTWVGLVKYFFVIIFVKILHEAAHAVTAVRFHCRVRGIGIGFMFFCPRFFTDTTDSWKLERKQRFLIDSAGILAEILTGGFAALLWYYLPPGALRSSMFYLLTVSTLSTLLINGNPFIRYDGYYILCDLTGIDNLMMRSSETVRQYWRWFFFHLGTLPGAGSWKLACFGVAAFLYRLFLYTSIIMLIYHKFNRVIAVIMIFLELYSILLYPFWCEMKTISRLLKERSNTVWFLLPAGTLIILTVFLYLPLGWDDVLPGEIRAEHRVIIAASESGFLKETLREKSVRKGESLCVLSSPNLKFALAKIEKLYQEEDLLRILQEQDLSKYAEANLTKAKQASTLKAWQELLRRDKLLTIRAPMKGKFIPVSYNLYEGAFIPQSMILGHIHSPKNLVTAYADDQQIGRIRVGQKACIYIHGYLRKFSGTVRSVSTIPAVLEPTGLLQIFGGPIPVYGPSPNETECQSVQTLYRIEITMENMQTAFPGQIAKVSIRNRERAGSVILRLLLSIWRKESAALI